MKRTYRFAVRTGTVTCALPGARRVVLPVIPGILKHPAPDELSSLLTRPAVVRKYTLAALRYASWPVLRQFPREWLRECVETAPLRPSRKRALRFLLSSGSDP
jgi:hypothetical protein